MRHARITLVSTLTALAALAVAGCTDGTSGTSGTHEPSASTSPDGPRSMEGVEGPLEPGSWAVPLFADHPHRLPRAVVEVPPGYGSPGGWVVDRGADGDPDEYGDVAFWVVRDLAVDPCHGTSFVRPGAGVRALVHGLAAQPGHATTRPRPVTVDGHRGLYVELRETSEDLRGCHESSSDLWRSTSGFVYGFGTARSVIRCWVLDVDGLRVVMTAMTTPHETPTEAAEVVGIAESAHFIGPLDS